jgi:small redox-active disulfide protein 2
LVPDVRVRIEQERALRMEDHSIIRVGKAQIGIVGLKETLEKVVKDHAHKGEEVIKEELFKCLKVRNYIPVPAKEEYVRAFWREYQKFVGLEVAEESYGLEIKILGAGCPNCERLGQEVYEILSEINLDADVEHVRDLKEIASYGFVATPGLVINGRLVSAGKVPGKAQVTKWLEEAKPKE